MDCCRHRLICFNFQYHTKLNTNSRAARRNCLWATVKHTAFRILTHAFVISQVVLSVSVSSCELHSACLMILARGSKRFLMAPKTNLITEQDRKPFRRRCGPHIKRQYVRCGKKRRCSDLVSTNEVTPMREEHETMSFEILNVRHVPSRKYLIIRYICMIYLYMNSNWPAHRTLHYLCCLSDCSIGAGRWWLRFSWNRARIARIMQAESTRKRGEIIPGRKTGTGSRWIQAK